MNIWNLPTKAHRDLWWLLTTPNIVEDNAGTSITSSQKFELLSEAWDWINRDAKYPSNLQAWVQNPHRQRKLGLYAEDLLQDV